MEEVEEKRIKKKQIQNRELEWRKRKGKTDRRKETIERK
jgi:hypothetical protein